MYLEKINLEFNKMFDLFNKYFYRNEIERPVIAIQTNGKHKSAMGWCTCNKIWRNKSKEEYYYEITICAEYLYRDLEEIGSTMLHEMVHLYCNQNNIKSTSRGNRYHNKNFKQIAEAHGLIIEYDKSIGWSVSKVNKEAKTLVKNNFNSSDFNITRGNFKGHGTGGADEGEGEEPKAKQSMRKYICPLCGTIIRATKDINVKCADCDELFVKEEI